MGLSAAGDWAESTVIVTTIGVASIVGVGWISYRGIEISARIQNLLIYFQYGVMILFTGALLWPVLSEGVPDGGVPLSWSMLDPDEDRLDAGDDRRGRAGRVPLLGLGHDAVDQRGDPEP